MLLSPLRQPKERAPVGSQRNVEGVSDSWKASTMYTTLPTDEDWIRLLFLDKGRPTDLLSAKLVPIKRVKAADGYEALSYTWETDTKTTGGSAPTILCNNIKTNIRPNLEAALRRLRRHDTTRVLWIDALCIDQSNEAERSHQVRMMCSIYSKALRTVVWLGEIASAQESAATSALNDICHLVNGWDENQRAQYSTWTTDPQTNEQEEQVGQRQVSQTSTGSGDEDPITSVETFMHLFRCQWFTRRWIIQEVVRSQAVEVMWGRHSLPWT
jgi:hypothetical protein